MMILCKLTIMILQEQISLCSLWSLLYMNIHPVIIDKDNSDWRTIRKSLLIYQCLSSYAIYIYNIMCPDPDPDPPQCCKTKIHPRMHLVTDCFQKCSYVAVACLR
jgi:hypothetical protein